MTQGDITITPQVEGTDQGEIPANGISIFNPDKNRAFTAFFNTVGIGRCNRQFGEIMISFYNRCNGVKYHNGLELYLLITLRITGPLGNKNAKKGSVKP